MVDFGLSVALVTWSEASALAKVLVWQTFALAVGSWSGAQTEFSASSGNGKNPMITPVTSIDVKSCVMPSQSNDVTGSVNLRRNFFLRGDFEMAS